VGANFAVIKDIRTESAGRMRVVVPTRLGFRGFAVVRA
jgi:hypothetical protein